MDAAGVSVKPFLTGESKAVGVASRGRDKSASGAAEGSGSIIKDDEIHSEPREAGGDGEGEVVSMSSEFGKMSQVGTDLVDVKEDEQMDTVSAAVGASTPTLAASSSTVSTDVPPAAQIHRPTTPLRRSRSPVPPSSSSSDDTIVISSSAVRRADLTVPRRKDPKISQPQESPDSLRMMPVTSSAVKSIVGGSRSRSQSLNPVDGGDALQSSPSRASSVRQRSKTPLAQAVSPVGENVDPSRPPRGRTSSRPFVPTLASTGGERDGSPSSDELAMPATSQVSHHTATTSSFMYVDVPARSSESNSRRSSTATARPTPPASRPRSESVPREKANATDSEKDEVIIGDRSGAATSQKRRKKDHAFESVGTSQSTSRPTSPIALSPSRSRSSSPKPPSANSDSRPKSSSPATAPAPHPLSEVAYEAALDIDDNIGDDLNSTASSPLSEIPPSSIPRTDLPSPSKRSRTTSSDAIDSNGISSSQTDESPKKRGRVPKVTKKKQPEEIETTAEKVKSKRSSTTQVSSAPVSTSESKPSNDWAVRPKRGKTAATTFKEVTTDDGEGASETEMSEEDRYSSRRSSPTKKRKKVEEKGDVEPSKRAAVAKGKKKDVSKTKAKGKAKKDEEDEEETPASSPSKNALRPASSFMFELSQGAKALRELPSERMAAWDVREFDEYVWVHIERDGDKGGFWWLGRITNALRSERPLVIELYLDPDHAVLNHVHSRNVSIDEPTPDNILKFRARFRPTNIRFVKQTFLDKENDYDVDSTIPTDHPACPLADTAFDSVLGQVLERERSNAGDDSDDDSDELPDPSQIGTSQRSKQASQKSAKEDKKGKKKKVEVSESEESDEKLSESESEDEDLKEDDEATNFPFYCLAKSRGGWWAASCLGYADDTTNGSISRSRNDKKQKFSIQYADGTMAKQPKSSLLFSRQHEFVTVKVQETILEFKPEYLPNALKFLSTECIPTFERVINESYPPAQDRNESFFSGGSKRAKLAQTSVFGELPDRFVEAFSDLIESWMVPKEKKKKDKKRPTGSVRYERLTELERISYVADVLLPIAIVLNYIDDRSDGQEEDDEDSLVRLAKEELKREREEEGLEDKEDFTEEEIEMKVYQIAYKELSSRSATKAIKSMRENRKTAIQGVNKKKKKGRR